jgi:HPr kinase/phosphorylase
MSATTSPPISIAALLAEPRLVFLGLELLAGRGGVESQLITNPRIQKPGLALAGYAPYVKPGRLQILGESEYAYLQTLGTKESVRRLTRLIELGIPAAISTKGNRPPAEVIDRCDELNVPCIGTSARTADVIEGISVYLEEELAPKVQLHGVLLDVFSLGTLIVGDAGIGKSECALELVYRGHRLVADDLVVIARTHNHGLRGCAHPLLQNFLELRGVGIIDVRKHFGMTATSASVAVSLVIELVKLSKDAKALEQAWREKMMERPHAWTSTQEILGIDVPKYTMAVAPGRDVAIMVETAVRKCLLAQRGIQDERRFLEAINRIAAGEKIEDLDDDDV